EPWALARRDAVTQFFGELVSLRGGHAAELGHDAAGFISLYDPCCRHEKRLIAVEIGPAGLEIFLPPVSGPTLPLLVLDEDKRAGSEDMGLRELRVLGEFRGTIDAVPGRGEIRQHRRIGPLQMKNDG